MTMAELNLIIGGFLGSLGFALLYHIKGKRLIAAAGGGILCCALFVLLGLVIKNEPVIYFLVSLATSIYSEILARVLKKIGYISAAPCLPRRSEAKTGTVPIL